MRGIIPKSVKDKSDPENYSIRNFMRDISETIPQGSRLLDAGAGHQPYRNFFSQTHYEATDFEDIFDSKSIAAQDFVCNLDNIPKDDCSYDVVINTQVLEHVPNPQEVVNEFYRILKPGGSLYLTAPQGWGVHGAPYHYFNFTVHGLDLLFQRAGFDIQGIHPRGGYFWYLAKRIKTLPSTICEQYFDSPKNATRLLAKLSYKLSFPFLEYLVPYILFHMDTLDKEQNYTLGYACHCIKPKHNAYSS